MNSLQRQGPDFVADDHRAFHAQIGQSAAHAGRVVRADRTAEREPHQFAQLNGRGKPPLMGEVVLDPRAFAAAIHSASRKRLEAVEHLVGKARIAAGPRVQFPMRAAGADIAVVTRAKVADIDRAGHRWRVMNAEHRVGSELDRIRGRRQQACARRETIIVNDQMQTARREDSRQGERLMALSAGGRDRDAIMGLERLQKSVSEGLVDASGNARCLGAGDKASGGR